MLSASVQYLQSIFLPVPFKGMRVEKTRIFPGSKVCKKEHGLWICRGMVVEKNGKIPPCPPLRKGGVTKGLHRFRDDCGNVEKSRQRRSRPFAVLTYYEYAPRVKTAAALLDGLF